ncbi:pyridoxamine 5'-phosphate oxidase family protein [Streptomyces sp. L7]
MPEDAQPAIALLSRTDHGKGGDHSAGAALPCPRRPHRPGRPTAAAHAPEPRPPHACVGSVACLRGRQPGLGRARRGAGGSAQVIGACEPREADGRDPGRTFRLPARDAMVYLRIEPRLGTVHALDSGLERGTSRPTL